MVFQYGMLLKKGVNRMRRLHFQEVWDRTLSLNQKKELDNAFHLLPKATQDFELTPFRMTSKKNGGLVATLFLRNETEEALTLRLLAVQLVTGSETIAAEFSFQLPLVIPAHSAVPWSFVFPPESVFLSEACTQEMTAVIRKLETSS